MKYKLYLVSFFVFFSFFSVFSKEENPHLIYKINIKKEIGSTTWIYLQKGFKEAEDLGAKHIIIHMNTYGGEVLYADSIRTKILNSKMPSSVFIDNNAASAGALISIACDNIYMRRGASIGAASVVDGTGEKMPDKYQSYMRATIRSTAEAHGKDEQGNWKRDPLIAEAMVDESVIVPFIKEDSTKILTFTAEEALKYHYCEGIVESVEEIIQDYLKIEEYTIKEYKASTLDEIKGFLTGTIFRGVLIMIIIGGIYFELQTPGVGFPLIAAISAAILYFAPLYIEGLAEHWEIILFVLGLVLLFFEFFVSPGLFVFAILGIVLIISGLVFSLLDNIWFDFTKVQFSHLNQAALTVVLGMLGGGGLIVYLSSKIGESRLFNHLAMMQSMDKEQGYIGVPLEQENLIGKTGESITALRLAGKVMIEGKIYDAISEESFIEQGEKVQVSKYSTGQIYVKKVIK